jgi:glyoxylase-like metal-dependent hydrolase (beta-lactamase superfamily II)/ferredoxin
MDRFGTFFRLHERGASVADPKKAVAANVPGQFFVDTTCINCDTCRQLAPSTFVDNGDFSAVFNQPTSTAEERQATRALLCCPTGSIGTHESNQAKQVMEDLPLFLADEVYYCGFNSPKSYGGNSFFIKHPQGNWLIDSPKFLPHLVKKFEQLGGIQYILLTHRDDVAEADRFAKQFSAQRIIHRLELSSQPDAETVIDGSDPIEFQTSFTIIPVPGHTSGHVVLLYKNRFLFTGDHLSYDRGNQRLSASRDYCWYSWPEQIESMSKLLSYSFEWVLAGHGDRINWPAEKMLSELTRLVARMKLPRPAWDRERESPGTVGIPPASL